MATNKNSQTILFLLVNNFSSGGSGGTAGSGGKRSGLLNSAQMTAAQITAYLHYKTAVEIVADVKAIPAAINQYNPKYVILEAIWATPSQVANLTKLYPDVVFVTRVHSEVPFLSHENNAINYIKQLSAINDSYVGFNSYETYLEFFGLGIAPAYLPNIYADVYSVPVSKEPFKGKVLNVGCFGSIRPMKNQLFQALAAVLYGKINGVKIIFHLNYTRVEQQGGCVLGNIRALFAGTENQLVEHEWLDRPEFLALVKTMDLGMQLSFNESFNIVTADFVLEGVPIIVSDAINWMPKESIASVDTMQDVLNKMTWCLNRRHKAVSDNITALDKHNTQSIAYWKQFLSSI